MSIPNIHHIQLTRETPPEPPFEGIQVDRRLIVRAHDAVNMPTGVFLMRVIPPSMDNPSVFRSDFDAVCSVSDLFMYPEAVLNESDLKTIDQYKLKKNMLVYVIGSNQIYQLVGNCSDLNWQKYNPANEKNCKNKNGLAVTEQLNVLPFYRSSYVDIAIPGYIDEDDVFNDMIYFVKNLCKRLDYWEAVRTEETIEL